MTFAELLADLAPLNQDAPLIFMTNGREIGPGYHVTELRHSVSTGIDCGGQVETWDEARLQLLDGPGDAHMSVAKFRQIIDRALGKLSVLADTSFVVEFGPDNAALTIMTVGAPRARNANVVLPLVHSRAVCKPAQRQSATLSCCGSNKAVTPAAECCA